MPTVTGEETFFRPDPAGDRTRISRVEDTLPRRHKSRLVLQGCTSADIPIPCDIPNVTGEETFFGPDPDGDRTWIARLKNPTLYRVAIKAGLYRKAEPVCYIRIPSDILPLYIEIRPRISGSIRITGNETQGSLMHMRAIYVGRQK